MTILRQGRDLLTLRAASSRTHVMLESQVRPPTDERVTVMGDDPVRILVVGAGLAVGYGVPDRRRALDGQTALTFAGRTRRGVVVETRVRPYLQLHDTIDLLGASGAMGFGAVVWSPTFREAFRVVSARIWARRLDRIVAHLRSTGRPGTGLVLLGLPEVDESSVAAAAVLRSIRAVNRGIAAAAQRSGARYVAMPAMGEVDATSAFANAAYYTRCAEVLVPVLIDLLPAEAARRDALPLA